MTSSQVPPSDPVHIPNNFDDKVKQAYTWDSLDKTLEEL
jgi:hypothetical protein